MLEDRSYMRQPRFHSYRSATVTLVVMNVVAFLLQQGIYTFSHFPLDDYFALSSAGLKHGFLWQLFTFQFMHAGLGHLFFNCLAIYIFGRQVEEVLGRKNFFVLYFTSGVLGGMITGLIYIPYAIHWHWPSLRRNNKQPPRRLVKVHSQKASAWAQAKTDIEDL